MPAFLLPLLAKILPWLAGLVGVAATYFFVKHKGAAEEREKIKNQQAAAIEKQRVVVTKAIEKDKVIDKRVGEQVEKIREQVQAEPAKTPDDFKPGDIFKF